MDTGKLMVGQNIWMQAGDEHKEVTVTAVTEKYIEVEDHWMHSFYPLLSGGMHSDNLVTHKQVYRIQFDKNGKQPAWDGTIKGWDFGVFGLMDGWSPLPLGEWKLVDKL